MRSVQNTGGDLEPCCNGRGHGAPAEKHGAGEIRCRQDRGAVLPFAAIRGLWPVGAPPKQRPQPIGILNPTPAAQRWPIREAVPLCRQIRTLRLIKVTGGGAGEGNRTPDIQLGKLTFYL